MAINKYNKYNVWRRYKTYDSGKTWVAMDDYEAYQTEENVESCGYIPVTYRWVKTDGTMCNTETHTLYSRTRQQASYDRGQTWDWTEPAVYNYGEVIEENSPQCGYPIYQWVDAVGEYLCGVDSNQYDKYQKEKRQVSTNNGDTWTDTGEERRGRIIEYSSFDCGFVPQWRWELTTEVCANEVPSYVESAISRTIESGDVCKDGDKYTKEKIEISVDNGLNWGTTYPSDYIFKLKEKHSADCGYMEQWVTVEGEDFCGDADSLYSKYHKEKKKVSYDSGATWTDTDETRTSETFEELSTDCGYDKSTTVAVYTNGTVKYFDIEGALDKSKLTSSDTIKRVIVGSKVNGFGTGAFQNCSTLETVEMPDSVAYIGNYAFYKCSGLTKVVLDSALTTIGYSAFNGCSSLTDITIPNSVRTIGDGVFYYCSSLTGVTIPVNVTSISNSLFANCENLTGITIPNSIISIGNNAFQNCISLTGVTIPNSVISIGDRAFNRCSNLASLTVNSVTPPSLGENAIPYKSNATKYTRIYVPVNSVDTYKYADGWREYASQIEAIPS